jgi:metal-sulfur cluster biosynthetic enzyme
VLKAIGIADESKGFGAIGEKGLVMTNVPVADQPYGETLPDTPANVTTLAKIDKAAVYPTKEAATNGTATACIYVERTAVKVEVENKAEQVELADNVKVNVEFDGWALGNVNYGGTTGTGYYNTRQFDTKWLPYFNAACATSYLKYRMVGRTKFFTDGHETAYRTYFGRDVNYTNPATDPAAESFNTGLLNAKIAEDGYTLADKAATYTYENTFDENSQIWANTTYVGVKMKLTLPADQTDFYTIEGQPNTMLYKSTLPAEIAKNHSAAVLEARSAIEAAIQTDLESSSSTLNAGKEAEAKITSVSFDIEPVVALGERSAKDGSVAYTFTLKLTNVKNSINGAAETDMADADIIKLKALDRVSTSLAKVITGTTKVYKYVGGVSYYSVRIAHFGDIETPWSAPAEAYNNYAKIYPLDGQSLAEGTDVPSVNYGANRANAWLGRWGIVRNNWYKLSIDKIEGLGSPVPEDYSGKAGGTPDDNPGPKYYIQAHIHILPWVVRTQNVNF